MNYTIEPAFLYNKELTHLILKASKNMENQWFFTDRAYNSEASFNSSALDTWNDETYVIIYNNTIIAFIEGHWSRPLDIILGFRMIFFTKRNSLIASKAFFSYLEYLFISRGCLVFNWSVATKNIHALKIYDRFISKYCGRIVGIRTDAQMSYTGIISDTKLYEITREEYNSWQKKYKSAIKKH